jgi:hypothetical protein
MEECSSYLLLVLSVRPEAMTKETPNIITNKEKGRKREAETLIIETQEWR